jgi:alpha-glucoside transport system ATP-binding protein
MTSLTLQAVTKNFGAHPVLKGIDLDIVGGEFVVFVGPSGCGKSTLLRLIAGLEEASGGILSLDGRILNHVPPAQRGIAMVFQSYALYPHMTVYDNMAFGLKIEGLPRPEIGSRVRHAAEALQLTPLLDRLPKALSGGQRQRVAIGRAICRNPRVFLFDEPLSNLDAALRVATRLEIARLKQSMPETTMIYVTHDQVEAMTLADRIVVLSAGQVAQIGTPMELYHSPANTFVAQFIGSPAMNLLPCRGTSRGVALRDGTRIDVSGRLDVDGAYYLGVRPEHLVLSTGPALLAGRVLVAEALGEYTQIYLETAAADQPVIVKLPGDIMPAEGDALRLSADHARLHIFGADGLALPRAVL